MSHRFLLVAIPLMIFSAAGCLGPDFTQKLKSPVHDSVYLDFVDDLLDPVRASQWAWARSRSTGEIDGILSRDAEEAVLVTLQEGSLSDPGPILRAILLVCRRESASQPPILIGRRIVYDADDPWRDGLALPAGLAMPPVPADGFTQGRVELQQPMAWGPSLIKVSLFRPVEAPHARAAVFHRVYTLEAEMAPPSPLREPGENGVLESVVALAENEAGAAAPPERRYGLESIFMTLVMQPAPVLRALDIDRDGQLDIVVLVNLLPPWIDEIADFAEPLWPAIWMGTPEGFARLDERHPRAALHMLRVHPHLARDWYRAYAEALAQRQPADRLAWLQYHAGVLHMADGDGVMARRRFGEVMNGAPADSPMRSLAAEGLKMLDE